MHSDVQGRTKFGLLGALEVRDRTGQPVSVTGRQPRLVLAMLVAAAGRPVSADALVDALWRDDPPQSAHGTLQTYVSRLRRVLDGAGGPGVVFDPAGYRTNIEPNDVDITRFEALASKGVELLRSGQTAEARDVLAAAEALWRGPALVDLADVESAAGPAARLEERRLTVTEERLSAELELGRHGVVVGQLRELVAAHPLREGLRAQLAVALYRTNQQADAMRVLSDGARILRDELGLEPSQELRDLELAILEHDVSLSTPGRPASTAPWRSDPSESRPSAPEPRAPLVGRASELDQLAVALDEAAADARFVVIEGEPGIGKTRLADELRLIATAHGSMAIWARTDEGGAAPTLWPWLAPLRTLSQRLGAVPPMLDELLAGAATAPGEASTLQFERFEAVATLLERAGSDHPVVLLLDDLQWADATSLALLGFLAHRLGPGVLVVITVRQLEVGRQDDVTEALAAIARRAGSRRLLLRSLNNNDVVSLLARTCSANLTADVAAAISSRAEGNPFYAIELGRLVDDEGAAAADVPATVGDVIRRRLARLPGATIELLQASSVAGRDIDLDLLARSTGLDVDQCVEGLEPAVAHHALIPVDGRPWSLRFSHALVREVLLDGLTSLRRARLHLRMADAIEDRGAGVDDAEILAEHLFQAVPLGVTERAATALEHAADVAVRRVSYPTAQTLLERAAALRRSAGDDNAELDALYRLIDVIRSVTYFAGVDHHLTSRAKELAERVGRRDALFGLLFAEWSALANGRHPPADTALANTIYALTVDDPTPSYRALGHLVRGVDIFLLGPINAATVHIESAYDLLGDVTPRPDAMIAELHLITQSFWILAHTLRGLVPFEDIVAEADALIDTSPDPVGSVNVSTFAACAALCRDRLEVAEHFVRRTEEADPASRSRFWGAMTLMQRAILLAASGNRDDAVATFAEGRDQYRSLGARSGLIWLHACMSIELTRGGHLADSVDHADAARHEIDLHGERFAEGLLLIAEAYIAHATADHDTLQTRLREAIVLTRATGALGITGRAERAAIDLGLSL